MRFLSDISTLRNLSIRFKASAYWKDIAWLASGTVVAQAVMLATMPVFSRIFTPADFAVQNLFGQIVGLVVVAATLRYEYFIQLPKQDEDARLLVQLVAVLGGFTTTILTPVLWLFRGVIARWAGDVALAPWLPFIPVTAAAMAVAVAVQGYTQRQRLFRRSGEAELAGKVGYAGTILAGWCFLPGAGGLVMGWLGASLGKIAWLLRGTLRGSCGGFVDLLRLGRTYSRMGGSLVLSHAFLSCTGVIPSVFIAHAYGSETLGQYALASLAIFLPSALLGSAIGSVYFQRASERWAQGLSFEDIWRSTAKRLLLIGLPLYAAAILIMPSVFPLVFGKVWRPAGYYGAILAVSGFFAFVTTPMDRTCWVVGAWRYILLWHVARTVTTGMVVGMALYFQWDMDIFMIIFVVQQIVLFLIDFWAEWRFAHFQPPHTPPTGGTLCVGP